MTSAIRPRGCGGSARLPLHKGVRRFSRALAGLLAAIVALLAPAAAQADGGLRALAAAPLTASLTSGPPLNIALPTVAGAGVQGQMLTAASGSWSPSATSIAYQWQRDTGSGFADIAGATGTTYVLVTADIGARVRVHATAANAAGSGTADANPVGPVIAGTPASTAAPTISGSLVGGRTLSASLGTWYPTGTSYAYQWQRDTGSGFADVASATGSTYTTAPADLGASLRVRVTATNSFASVTASSNALGPVTTGRPVSAMAPVITGTAKRGVTLAANGGTWSPAPTSFAYQWQRDEGDGDGFEDVAGAETTSYTPGDPDIGKPLRVVVTATNAFGSATATSSSTASVATDPPANVGSPSIVGSARRTATLTASPGSWTPAGASYAYQWQRDAGSGFADITGATGPSYTLVAADVGAVIRVLVKATNVDGNVTAASAPTTTVLAATPGVVGAPTLTRATRVGEQATTSDGAWSPAAASFAYQWQRKVSGAYVDISGATSKTYTLVAADAGTTVRSEVTATNADGDAVAYSAPTSTIVAPPVPPAAIAAPTGTLVDTGTLVIDAGSWSPSSATFTYQWLRCPAGATVLGGCVSVGVGPSYTLVGPDVGHTIAVRVTGTVAGAATVATSTFTGNVTGRALTLVTAPTMGGTAQVASTVRGVPALWSVPTLTERWQWRRCETDGTGCVDIAGATHQDYKVGTVDKDHALVARLTATSWGRSAAADTALAVVADQPVPSNAAAPRLTGTARRTGNLQLTRGDWANDPTTFTYGWQRCAADGTGCTTIAGENRFNHVLTVEDVGHAIRGTVTAGNTEGSATAVSAPSDVVAKVMPQLTAIGPVTGTLQVPRTLQVQRSSWNTTQDTRYTYQWQRCDGAGTHCADIEGARSQSYRLQTVDARTRLQVVHTATNADGSTVVATTPTAPIAPATPGLMVTPRLGVVGRPDVGKSVTLTPGKWSAATEITTKTLTFWRCAPTCAPLSTGGAGSYVLADGDAGALIRGSETAVGPGGTVVAWAASWIGPVHSTTAASSSLSARGGSATLRTSSGVALARATVSSAAARTSVAARGHGTARNVRIALRRAKVAPAGRLRAWACPLKPAVDDATPCSRAVTLRSSATLRLAVPVGQRVRVVVVRK